MQTSIRFQHMRLQELRQRLLADTSREYLAVLLAKERIIGDLRVLTVMDARFPREADYSRQHKTGLAVGFDGFMRAVLVEASERLDVDAVIDVHTHPFQTGAVRFSLTDDADERTFCRYLTDHGLGYASIVLGLDTYEARWWEIGAFGLSVSSRATVRGQTALESIPASSSWGSEVAIDERQDRGVRALGLDAMRRIASGSRVTVVGVGGLGSVAAEHLVHMGFAHIALIDHDVVETTNLNRLVGARADDALAGRAKVEVVRDHLTGINPGLTCEAVRASVFDEAAELAIAKSDWVLLCTDNHASRYHVQELCFRYFVPFVTAGVNITVEDGRITDYSGETILVRMGERLCLACLGRVDFDAIAAERHPDARVRAGLVERGYVTGSDVVEPAVKTLNAHLATLATDTLVNQYTGRRPDAHVLVYEENGIPVIYEDRASVKDRNPHCSICGL